MAQFFHMVAFVPLSPGCRCRDDDQVTELRTPVGSADPPTRRRLHRAWLVAAVAFVATIGAAGFRATPGVFIDPLHAEFGWSTGVISAAVSVNLVLFGLTAPFAAALM